MNSAMRKGDLLRIYWSMLSERFRPSHTLYYCYILSITSWGYKFLEVCVCLRENEIFF